MRLAESLGDDAAVRAGVARYGDGGASSPALGPIARTDFDATLVA